ncbi:MAG: hypothetical protein EBZ78_07410 [Verrucomicrobia bacterium]|nr:hypothetical protein [Verrucomicrobiota bacterium]
MQLRFPHLNGGVANGLNDAGIETFEGDSPTHIIRECAQNSLDAALSDDHPVHLEIRRLVLGAEHFPFKDGLLSAVQACKAHWLRQNKAKQFFERAQSILEQPVINVLKVSDLGTKGVPGDDTDMDKPWYGLVKSRGVSNKDREDSGGAFGIGKDAPLAASPLRTVIYSTLTLDGSFAIQGVARLVTHRDLNGMETQGTGFIGDFDPARTLYKAIRDPKRVNAAFHRQQPGLDVYILGMNSLQPDWERSFIQSALANFWPAIHNGRLTFDIHGTKISRENLARLMESEKEAPSVRDAYPYYESVVHPEAVFREKEDVPTAGRCRLHALVGKVGLPKKICMVRKTGMVIHYYSPKITVIPFSGLFVCDDREGNKILKSLEPPRHDKFETGRAETPQGRRILRDIQDWIRTELQKLIPASSAAEINETNLPRDLLDIQPGLPPEDSGEPEEEDITGKAKEVSQAIALVPPSRTTRRARAVRKTNRGGGGTRKGGSGRGGGHGPHGRGGTGGSEDDSEWEHSFESRFFRGSSSPDEIVAVLKSGADLVADVEIVCLGEDDREDPVPVQLSACRDVSGKNLTVGGSLIRGLSMKKDLPLRLHLKTRHLPGTALAARPVLPAP